MITFPNCKINLGLHVIEKRADGYHNIETCFYPVPWCDVLEVIPSRQTNLHISGIELQGDRKANLVYKAYELLNQDFGLKPVEIFLHKNIPHGAGLGGGSSDGANTLLLLNKIFKLHLTHEELEAYALKLGSDCPFFLDNKPVLAAGRGEMFSPSNINLNGCYIVIVKPQINVSTSEAYRVIKPQKPSHSLDEILSHSLIKWRELLVNDFEQGLIKMYPLIGQVKTKLYDSGALYASMSGSGSAVYGLFESEKDVAKDFPSMKIWGGFL